MCKKGCIVVCTEHIVLPEMFHSVGKGTTCFNVLRKYCSLSLCRKKTSVECVMKGPICFNVYGPG